MSILKEKTRSKTLLLNSKHCEISHKSSRIRFFSPMSVLRMVKKSTKSETHNSYLSIDRTDVAHCYRLRVRH